MNQTTDTSPTDRFVDKVPGNWTPLLDIPVDFVTLETLAYVGRVEMQVREIVSPNGIPMGSQHLFRRAS